MDSNISITDVVLNTIQEKREFLKKLSIAASELVESGEFQNVNEAVINTFYIDKEHTEFKTFSDWRKAGYKVKKGSKAFIVWGKPKNIQEAEKAEAKGEEPPVNEDSRDFYPIAFIFSNAQVERRQTDV